MPLTFNFGEENRPELFEGKPKTPVTLLSGFLGTGKTSLLKHLLENQEGVRIGVVVNDVAAVNIDSQLVKKYETGTVEVTELQNGCVCCSSADDLFTAVQSIVMRSKDYMFEHIVVELSGVGEPEAVKRNWTIGLECTMPVALRTEVKQVVTVVDASTFGRDWLDTRQAQDRNEEVHGDKHDEKNKARLENVGQLLAEQVEWADVVVVNKTDLATAEELRLTEEVVAALNRRAPSHHARFGGVAPSLVLPMVPKGLKVAERGQGEGYRWAQTPANITVRLYIDAAMKGRDIDFKVGKQMLKLGVKGQPKKVAAGRLSAEIKDVDDVVFEIEGSGPERCAMVVLEKRRSAMWPDLWDGSGADAKTNLVRDYARGHAQCGENCADTSHDHTPAGSSRGKSRAEERFGIHSFSFLRRRPFSADRLDKLLKAWPTPRKEFFSLDELAPQAEPSGATEAVLRPVLRSKGFCWIDHEPLKQHVWAHAGRTLAVKPADWWWSALDPEQLKFKVTYPGVEAEYKMARREKWDKAVGDRRQELVFIGGPTMREEDIVPLLEECLLSDDEYAAYRQRTKEMKVPDDDFHVNGLLKNLGATPDQIKEINGKAEARGEEEKQRRKQDREETDFLRSLGVGCGLEPEEDPLPDPLPGREEEERGRPHAAVPDAFEPID